jgi:hypothetical protein
MGSRRALVMIPEKCNIQYSSNGPYFCSKHEPRLSLVYYSDMQHKLVMAKNEMFFRHCHSSPQCEQVVWQWMQFCIQALFSSTRNPKRFQDSLSHQILRHMHKALNIDENKNYSHSLTVNRETNLLTLVSLWLDNIYHKQTKVLQ